MLDAMVRVKQGKHFTRWHILGGWGENWAKRIVVIAMLNPRTALIGAFDIEERAMQCPQLFRRVVCSLRKI